MKSKMTDRYISDAAYAILGLDEAPTKDFIQGIAFGLSIITGDTFLDIYNALKAKLSAIQGDH
jgi:hypothetical protein